LQRLTLIIRANVYLFCIRVSACRIELKDFY
jgi:hypothetical protein